MKFKPVNAADVNLSTRVVPKRVIIREFKSAVELDFAVGAAGKTEFGSDHVGSIFGEHDDSTIAALLQRCDDGGDIVC